MEQIGKHKVETLTTNTAWSTHAQQDSGALGVPLLSAPPPRSASSLEPVLGVPLLRLVQLLGLGETTVLSI